MHDQQEEALSLVLEHSQAQHCTELRLLGLQHIDAAPDLVGLLPHNDPALSVSDRLWQS